MAKVKRHPHSVSATELSKLGQCEVMVALDLADQANDAMKAASARGDAAHDHFHRRAVINAGTQILARQL
jgi:hypothetical protein